MNLKGALLAGLSLFSSAMFSQDFNYGEALQKSILFYEAQQSGPLPEWNRVSWRGDSAIDDGSDVGHDLTGGWYDAGDHVKFGFPMAYSATILAWGGIEYKDAYEESGQMEHLKNNLRFVCDYLLKCHTAPTELYGQLGNGSIDHGYWGASEVMTVERPAYKIDAENPGSDLASETAAAMAAASIIFADDDPAYSATLLEHAEQLYSFADNYRGKYSDAITDATAFYNSWSGYQDEIVWGAAWLYRATGDSSYLTKAQSEYANLSTEIGSDFKSYKWGLAWDDKSYGCYILMSVLTGDDEYKTDAERHLDFWTDGYNGERIAYSPGGQAHLTTWGSLRHSANTSLLAFIYSDKVESTKTDTYHDFAVRQINYALGDNPLGRSFMVGFGNDPANSVHHRAAHGPWSNSLEGSPDESSHVLYGALAGGPSAADDQFEDDRGDFIANEVATDYNAAFTGALARMYDEYGGNPLTNFPVDEVPTRSELRSYSKFNSNNDFGSTVSIMFQNRSAWPARVADNITMRYFLDISEAVEDGYTIDDIAITLSYSQSSNSSLDIKAWDEDSNIYYADISIAGNEISPVGDPAFRYEVQLQISTNNAPYDTSNDWSATGLTDSAAESTNIPVYDNGVLVFGEEPSGGDTPKAIFSADPETGFAPLEVNFNSSDSSDPNGDSITYAWDFGNGETSTLANPTIIFDETGTFVVSLVVSDGSNESTAYTTEITTQDSNITPVAIIGASATSGIAPATIDFDASDSYDDNGDNLTYSWDFADGSTSDLGKVSHTFDTAGEYKVVLTVSDGVKTDTESIIITINDGSPVISYSYKVESEDAPFVVNFDASDSSDPEGGDLNYAWDFGNLNSGTGATPSATYFSEGDYTVVLVVTNGSGKTTTQEFLVELGSSVCDFNTPISSALTSVNSEYTNVFLLGDGSMDVNSIDKFIINWNLENNGLYQFAVQMAQTSGGGYIGLESSPQSFNSSEPSVSISGSGVTGLDGDYYVAEHDGNFVMVSQAGDYTIYFSSSTSEPNCPDVTLSTPELNIVNYEILTYPNPVSDLLNIAIHTSDYIEAVEKEVSIVNLLGQSMLSKTITKGQTNVDFNVDQLASGVYLMQINIDGQLLTVEKVIIK